MWASRAASSGRRDARRGGEARAARGDGCRRGEPVDAVRRVRRSRPRPAHERRYRRLPRGAARRRSDRRRHRRRRGGADRSRTSSTGSSISPSTTCGSCATRSSVSASTRGVGHRHCVRRPDVHDGRAARRVRGDLGRAARRGQLPPQHRLRGRLGDPHRRRAQPGSAGGRPAELYRAGRAWKTVARSTVRTDEGSQHESRRPRQVRAAGGPAHGGRAESPSRGGRGAGAGARDDGHPDRLPMRAREPFFWRFISGVSARSRRPSASSSPASSRRSARRSPRSRSATGSSGSPARARTRSTCRVRELRLARTCRRGWGSRRPRPSRRRVAGAGPLGRGRLPGDAPPRLRRDRRVGTAAVQVASHRRPRHRRVRHEERRAGALARRRRRLRYAREDFTKDGEAYDVVLRRGRHPPVPAMNGTH